MRKQLRILLFAALVAVLVVMTALVISADYTVTDKDGAPVGENEGVYATLAEAVAAVTDGGTITVNGDVSDVATDLSKEGVSYTIKGGSTEGMNTLTITSAKFGGQTTLLYLSKGSVTLENVAIAGDASGGAVFHVYDEVGTMPSLTVNNVKVTATSAHAFWLRIACVLTIKGENTEIAGGTMTVMSLQNGVSGYNTQVNIEGGALTCSGTTGGISMATNHKLNMTGGSLTVTGAASAIVIGGGSAPEGSTLDEMGVVITGGSITSENLATPRGGAIFMNSSGASVTVGGTATIKGGNAIYINSKGKVVVNGGTVIGAPGAGITAFSAGSEVVVNGGIIMSEGSNIGVVDGGSHSFGSHAVWLRSTCSFTMTGGTLTNTAAALKCAVLLIGHGSKADQEYAVDISGGLIKSVAPLAHAILVYMSKPTITISGTAALVTEGVEFNDTTDAETGEPKSSGKKYAGAAIKLASLDAVLNITGGTITSAAYNSMLGDDYLDTLVDDDMNGAIIITKAKDVTISGGVIDSTAKHGITISGELSSLTIGGTYDEATSTWSTQIKGVSRGIYMRPAATLTAGGAGLVINGGYIFAPTRAFDVQSNIPIVVNGGELYSTNGQAIHASAANGFLISVLGGEVHSDVGHVVYLAGVMDTFTVGGTAYIHGEGDARIIFLRGEGSLLSKTEGEGENAVTTVLGKGFIMTGGTIETSYRAIDVATKGMIVTITGGTLKANANYALYVGANDVKLDVSNTTITSADGTSPVVFWSGYTGIVATFKNTTITAAAQSTAIEVSSAGINLTIEDCIISCAITETAKAGALYLNGSGAVVTIKGSYNEETSEWSTSIVGGQGIYINSGCTLTIDGASIVGTKGAGLLIYGGSTITMKNGVICSTGDAGSGVVNGTNVEGAAEHAFGAHAVWQRSQSTFNMEGGMLMNTGAAAANPVLLIRHGNTVNNAGNNLTQTVNISGGQIVGTAGPAIGASMGKITLNISGGVIMSTGASTILVGDLTAINVTGGVLSCYATEGEEYTPALVDFGGFAGSLTVDGGILVPYETGLVVVNAKEAVGDEAGTVVTAGESFAIVSMSGVAFAGKIFGYDDSVTVMMGDDECMGWAQYKGSAELILNLADGATARVVRGEEDETGIRFSTTIDAENAAIILGMKESGLTVTYGTLIAPAEYVVVAGGFTHAAMEAFEAEYEYDVAYVDVVANVSLVESAAGISFNAALVNIKEENMFREFVAVSYVCIDGTYYYSDFSTASNTSMMMYVAMDALSDVSSTQAGVYAYPSVVEQGKFSRYTEECQNYLLAFIPAV